eukprot:7706726-Karenia_brevis.AAC.1
MPERIASLGEAVSFGLMAEATHELEGELMGRGRREVAHGRSILFSSSPPHDSSGVRRER